VVRTTQDAREVSQEFKDRMKTLYSSPALSQPQGDNAAQQPVNKALN
jgi:hypothetical protein